MMGAAFRFRVKFGRADIDLFLGARYWMEQEVAPSANRHDQPAYQARFSAVTAEEATLCGWSLSRRPALMWIEDRAEGGGVEDAVAPVIELFLGGLFQARSGAVVEGAEAFGE